MNLMTTSHLLLSGIVIGLIFFQTALSAPIIFKHLSKDQSSIYIRKIFPKLFAIIAIIGAICFAMQLSNRGMNQMGLVASIITFTLPIICYLMVPATNEATDTGNTKKFKQLHTLSVLFIVVVFISNIFWCFL